MFVSIPLLILAPLFAPVAPQDPILILEGERGYGKFGSSTVATGDLNQDQVPDLVVGGYGNSAGHGGGGPSVLGYVQARSGTDGAVLWSVDAEGTFDRFGWSVANVGDNNGDGVDDLLVGAPYQGPYDGRVYLLDGTSGNVLWNRNGVGNDGQFGTAVGSVGDLDADGIPEFFVGAGAFRIGEAPRGRVYLYNGSTKIQIRVWTGQPGHNYFGYAAANAGDVDGDGFDDVVVGAYATASPQTSPGRAYVYSAATGSLIHQWEGQTVGDYFGVAVAGVGDVDGGGRPDLLVGANQRSDDAGAAYLLAGEDGSVIWTGKGEDPDDRYGTYVGATGDVNADGRPDWQVAAPNRPLDGSSLHGKYYVYSGSTENLLWSRTGKLFFSLLGRGMSPAGDHNGDGYDDFLVASFGWDGNNPGGYTGRAFLVAGGPYFELEVPALVPGTTVPLTASNGVGAGETVYFAYSIKGQGPQQVPRTGQLQLTDPILIGTAVEAGGAAVLHVPVPAGAPPGLRVYLQAALRRGGDWILSDAPALRIP